MITAVFESEANQTRVWVLIFASDLHILKESDKIGDKSGEVNAYKPCLDGGDGAPWESTT